MKGYLLFYIIALSALILFACSDPLDDIQKAKQEGDVATATRIMRQLAKKGNSTAQMMLGTAYASGDGVEQDMEKAVEWLRQAADNGNTEAKMRLSAAISQEMILSQDRSIKRTYSSPLTMWVQIKKGNLQASVDYADWLLESSKAIVLIPHKKIRAKIAFYILKDAADLSYQKAIARLADFHYIGIHVTSNHKRAFELWSRAAKLGHISSQFNVGRMYDSGDGIEKDFMEAAKWYLSAAKAGNANAQYALAILTVRGEGVKKDMLAGLKWFNKAAEQGHDGAQYRLGIVYYNGIPGVVDKDVLKAAAWMHLASSNGNKDATDALSTLTIEQRRAGLELSKIIINGNGKP